jgi:hypothetical protein
LIDATEARYIRVWTGRTSRFSRPATNPGRRVVGCVFRGVRERGKGELESGLRVFHLFKLLTDGEDVDGEDVLGLQGARLVET